MIEKSGIQYAAEFRVFAIFPHDMRIHLSTDINFEINQI